MAIIKIVSPRVEEYSLNGFTPSKFLPGEFYDVPPHVAFAMVRKGVAVAAQAVEAPMQGEPSPPPAPMQGEPAPAPAPAQEAAPAEQQQPAAEQPRGKGKRGSP